MEAVRFEDEIRRMLKPRKEMFPLFLLIVTFVSAGLLGYLGFHAWWGPLVVLAGLFVYYGIKNALFAVMPLVVGALGVVEGALGLYLAYIAFASPADPYMPVQTLAGNPALGGSLFLSLAYLGCRQVHYRMHENKLHEANAMVCACVDAGMSSYQEYEQILCMAALDAAKGFGACHLLYAILTNLTEIYKRQGKYDAAYQVEELAEEVKALAPAPQQSA